MERRNSLKYFFSIRYISENRLSLVKVYNLNNMKAMKLKLVTLVTLAYFLIPITSFAQEQNIMVNGKSRNMVVYAPKNIAQNRPLMIACHGSGASGPEHSRWRPFTSV